MFTEVLGLEGDVVITQDLFIYDITGEDAAGRVVGRHRSTGIGPEVANATRKVIDFCVEQQVGSLFIGNPHGVRNENRGRHHNQRMALWEYGKDIDYLTHKSEAAHIMSVTMSCDHRAVDGALGAVLIGAFKALIENPVMMLV